MKNQFIPFFVCVSSLFCFTSCKKLLDEVKKNPGVMDYKIAKIAYTSDAKDNFAAGEYDRVTYFNGAGEPTKSVVTNSFTGNSNQAFLYDAKGNLKKWILYFFYEPTMSTKPGDWNVFVYHGYSHDKFGKILTDTSYADHHPQYIDYYSYDAYDRIIKARRWFTWKPANEVEETLYSYDSNGNLKGCKYDNKLHFRRLSKVMMFLSRDYSVNNRFQSDPVAPGHDVYSYVYGKYSLPTEVIGRTLIPDEDGSTGRSEILYQ